MCPVKTCQVKVTDNDTELELIKRLRPFDTYYIEPNKVCTYMYVYMYVLMHGHVHGYINNLVCMVLYVCTCIMYACVCRYIHTIV